MCNAKMWRHQGSNQGPPDLQSGALPTELWHLWAFSLRYHFCTRTRRTAMAPD
ncbi:uncharacterized protein MICPUCDRAFT_56628 [Micromonas pusilla CCMP1545]|uniref:Predicted protein n=1 Tax=Micromonas pusilla (strain CCMP1545) TaxID=564608 RepID=C1MMR6_MICPC|nr:uncharacterized protein MICPUCDRAFT_56628 [Micromonas pusilla CCMP1545]EEH58619.1 predicted protein [Micromonas pusilla CCMP1545]|eukprot:XP_003056974.1 predicted protein [Micromonas pusilla CCMP1545]